MNSGDPHHDQITAGWKGRSRARHGQLAGTRRQLLLSLPWLVFNFEWGALLIIMPSQIALLGGEANKVHNVGIILPLGALVALLVTPIAGALSDRSRSPLGRRSVFLISGGMMNLIFLAAMALFGSGDSLALFMLCWLGLQFGANWWGGPYAGMIPDFIAEGERGMASGWMMAMSYVGTILGAGVASALLPLNYAAVYAVTALLLVGGLGVTIGGVKEWAWPATHPPASNASFFPGLEGNADFWLVLLTRSFMTMGSFTFLPFFAFFLRDAFQLPTNDDASQLFGLLLATTSALALPAALLGGRWADRHGPLREVRLGGWTTAACCMALAFVALRPGMASLLVVALVLAQGSALYQAVDWALAIAVLPSLGDAGRYMGIWHTSFVLPQTIAPFLASLLVGFDPSGAGSQAASAYAVLFLLAAFWSICGTLPLRFIRSAR